MLQGERRKMRIALRAILLCLALGLPVDRACADWQSLGTYRITGYCPCVLCCGKSDGITADGTYAPAAKERIIAAPKGIPFGTRMWIDGVGESVVHDRGGAIQGKRAELFFQTHKEALQWGSQEREVFIWVDKPK
jgi:3D (Asp-Asp-Asp) domain-containing protein